MNTAVSQMDKVTQSNAANAEESASAAEELNAQAEAMREAVGELLRLVDGHSGGHLSLHAPSLKTQRTTRPGSAGSKHLSQGHSLKTNGSGHHQVIRSPKSTPRELAEMDASFKDM